MTRYKKNFTSTVAWLSTINKVSAEINLTYNNEFLIFSASYKSFCLKTGNILPVFRTESLSGRSEHQFSIEYFTELARRIQNAKKQNVRHSINVLNEEWIAVSCYSISYHVPNSKKLLYFINKSLVCLRLRCASHVVGLRLILSALEERFRA